MVQGHRDDTKPSLGNSLGILQRVTCVMNYSQKIRKETNKDDKDILNEIRYAIDKIEAEDQIAIKPGKLHCTVSVFSVKSKSKTKMMAVQEALRQICNRYQGTKHDADAKVLHFKHYHKDNQPPVIISLTYISVESGCKIHFNGHAKNVTCHMCYMLHVTNVTCYKY